MASEPKVDVRCGARVTVTLEIDNVGAWGKDCALDQVFKQAAETAIGKLHKGLGQTDWRVVGKPLVRAILVDDSAKGS